jgi:hypothetical protein
MNIITAGVEQIRESYFEEVVEDHESFPTIHRASLLSEEFEGTAADLENDLLGWTFHFLHWSQMLWYSEEHLAAFLQLGYGPMTEIYLFTFADLASLQTGIDEIKVVCRQKR